ncbi:response regulator [Paenibacillus sp. FA6]|uniref:response regulator n=1 Tax=Paenibacillus sp. FA6 TaxID=3413029 RepID=UPI003F65F532
MISILIVDDHPVVLDGTKLLFQGVVDMRIETENDATQVMVKVREFAFDLYIIDINMKPLNGIELAQQIKEYQADARVILYTGYELSDYYELLLERKVDGLLPKTADKERVLQTIRFITKGEVVVSEDFLNYMNLKLHPSSSEIVTNFNEKELKIIKLLGQSYTNKAIAIEISLTQRTVENILTKIFVKLNVDSRIEAVMKAQKLKLL